MLNMNATKFVSAALESEAFIDDCNANRSAMLRAAINAARNAYCPYSNFHVGAALITVTADIYAGCNVENAMYNGMSHAELTAISNAIVHEGPNMRIAEMVIWTPTTEPVPSCGGCRQLIREHADPGTIIWSHCNEATKPPLGMTTSELLPHSFGPENLKMIKPDLCDQCGRQTQGCTISAGRTVTCARFSGKTGTWIEYNKNWGEFCEVGLNKPGTQICVQDFHDLRKQSMFLIGDINVLGGVCDDCQKVLDNQTVIRYRILEML